MTRSKFSRFSLSGLAKTLISLSANGNSYRSLFRRKHSASDARGCLSIFSFEQNFDSKIFFDFFFESNFKMAKVLGQIFNFRVELVIKFILIWNFLKTLSRKFFWIIMVFGFNYYFVSSCGNESRYSNWAFGFRGPILQIPLSPLKTQNKYQKSKKIMKFHEFFQFRHSI